MHIIAESKGIKKAFSFNLHFNILPSVVFFIHLCCYRTVDSICSSNQTSASLRWKGALAVGPGTQWLKPFSAPSAVTSVDWRTRPPLTLTVKGTSSDRMVYKFSVSNAELTLFFSPLPLQLCFVRFGTKCWHCGAKKPRPLPQVLWPRSRTVQLSSTPRSLCPDAQQLYLIDLFVILHGAPTFLCEPRGKKDPLRHLLFL